MKSFYKCLIIVPLILFLSAGTLQSQVSISSVVVTTPPATSCTNTILTVTGFLNASYIFNGTPFTVTGTTIAINVDYLAGIIVLPVITPFSHQVNLGMLAPGTYNVTTTGTLNSTITSTLASSFTVVSCCPAVPSFTVNATDICEGDSLFLTNTSTGSISQKWYENNNQVSVAFDYATKLNTAGTYTYKLVVTDGSCSDSTDEVVEVFPHPAIDLGNDTSICDGMTVILDAGAGRQQIIWSTMATGRYLAVNTAGKYKVEVAENGCWQSDSITIGTLPGPSVDLGPDTTICFGDSILLDANIGTGVYLWQDGSSNSNFTVHNKGLYWVIAQATNGCIAYDSVVVDTVHCLPNGIQSWPAGQLTNIFPNPAKDHLMVTLNQPANGRVMNVDVLDMQGKNVYSNAFRLKGDQFNIQLPELSNGIYLIIVRTGSEQWAGKFSIDR